MAGQDPAGQFNAAEFRAQIRAAMNLGLPVNEADRPTFYFPVTKTYATADASGAPLDYTAAPTATSPATPRSPVQVPCAVEVAGETVEFRNLGELNASTVKLTLLDEDWATVDGFSEVTLGGDTYLFSHVLPPLALFDAGVIQVVVRARDES